MLCCDITVGGGGGVAEEVQGDAGQVELRKNEYIFIFVTNAKVSLPVSLLHIYQS